MDLAVTGRGTTVTPALREYVTGKLDRLQRLDPLAERLGLELHVERNPRIADEHMRVNLSWHGTRGVFHAHGCGATAYAAAEEALHRMDRQLRTAHEQALVHHGRHAPETVRTMPAPVDPEMDEDTRWLAKAYFGDDPELVTALTT